MVLSRWSLVVLLVAGSSLPAAPRPAEPLRIGTSRLRHGGLVRSLAFSPDGRWLASASHDQTASVWEVATGKEHLRLTGHDGDFLCVAFAPGGEQVASGGADGTIRVWSLRGPKAGTAVHLFRTKAESVDALAYSPDGKTLVAGGDDGGLEWYDLAPPRLRQRLVQDQAVRSLAFSSDGKQLASTGGQTIVLRDATTGKVLRSLAAEQVACIAYAPGRHILAGKEVAGPVRLWDADSSKLLAQGGQPLAADGPKAMTYQIAFSADGKTLLCGGLTGAVEEYEVETLKSRRTLSGHRERVTALATSRDGLAASGGADGVIRLWDLRSGKARFPVDEPSASIIGLSVAPKGKRLAIVLATGEVQVYDRTNGRLLGRASPGSDGRYAVHAAAFLPDGETLLSLGENRLEAWNFETGKRTAQAVGTSWTALGLSADGGTLALLSRDGTLSLSGKDGKRRLECEGRERGITLAVSPDGQRIAGVGRMAGVLLWDGKTGQSHPPLSGHRGGTLAAGFAGDGKTLATGGRDRLVRVWDLGTRREVFTPCAHDAWVCAVALSAGGKLLATGTVRGEVQLWSARTGRLLADLPGHRGPITALAFADADRALVSTGRDMSVLVRDVSRIDEARPQLQPLDPARRSAAWEALRDTNEALAALAMQRLIRDPKATVEWIAERIAPVDGAAITALIGKLNAADYKDRQSAYEGLAKQGRRAEEALRQALARKPALETARRLEELLARLAGAEPTAEHARGLRAVEVLGRIGTPEARKVLEKLNRGDPEASLTRAARRALTPVEK